MDKESIVNHILENISFEVEAVPQENIIQLTSAANTTPLNVKIKARKKIESENEVYLQQGFMSVPKFGELNSASQRIRLVNSDQTIMSFKVFMEAKFDGSDLKKKSSKQKHFFGNLFNFKPGGCLDTRGDDVDDYSYMPSSSNTNEVLDENITRSDSQILKQNFPLSNEVPYQVTSKAKSKKHKGLFRNCKPGGCLDPPFSEDKYPYRPLYKMQSVEEKSNDLKIDTLNEKLISSKEYLRMKIKEEVDSTERETKKEQMDIKSALSLRNTESSLDLKYFDSIITYPTVLSSNDVSGKNIKIKRNSDEEKNKKVYNNLNNAYFTPSKDIARHKTLKDLDEYNENDSIPLKSSITNIQINPENKTKEGIHKNNILRSSLTDELHTEETFTYLNGLHENLNYDSVQNINSEECNKLLTQTKYLKIGHGSEESKCYKDTPETKTINGILHTDIEESVNIPTTKTHEITMSNYDVASGPSDSRFNKADVVTNFEIKREMSELPLLDTGIVKEKKTEVAVDFVKDNVSTKNFENEIESNKYNPSEDNKNTQNNVIKSTKRNIMLDDGQINQHTRQDQDITYKITVPYIQREKPINIEDRPSGIEIPIKISPEQTKNITESSNCKTTENVSMAEFEEKFIEHKSSPFLSNVNQIDSDTYLSKRYTANDIIYPENKNKTQGSDVLQRSVFTDSIVFENDALLESVKNLSKMESKEKDSAVIIKKPLLINSDMSDIHDEAYPKNKLLKHQSLTVIDANSQLQKDTLVIQNRSDNNLVDNQTEYKQRSSESFFNEEQLENTQKPSNQTFKKSAKDNQDSSINDHTSLKFNGTFLEKSDEKLSTSITSFVDKYYHNRKNNNSNVLNPTYDVESSNKVMDRLSTTSLYDGKLNNANFTPLDKINVNNQNEDLILMNQDKNDMDRIKPTHSKNTSNALMTPQIVERKEISLSNNNDSYDNLKSEIDTQIKTTPHYYYKTQNSLDNTVDSNRSLTFNSSEKNVSPTFFNKTLRDEEHEESPDIKDMNQKMNQFIEKEIKENNIYTNEISATIMETSETKLIFLSSKPSLIKVHKISKLDSKMNRNVRTDMNNVENMQSFSFIQEPSEELQLLPYKRTNTSEFIKPVTKLSTSLIDTHKKTDTESQIKNMPAEDNVVTTLILSPIKTNENRNQSLSQTMIPVEPVIEKKSFNHLEVISKKIDNESTFANYNKNYISELTTDESKKSVTITFNDTEIPTDTQTLKTPVINTFTNTQDALLLDLAFHRYLNDNKERVLKTMEFDCKSNENVDGNLIIIKSAIKSDTGEICVPIDSRNDISINILKKIKQDELDDIHNVKSIIFDAQHEIKKSKHNRVMNAKDLHSNDPNFKLHSQVEHNDDKIIHEALTVLYEQELIPLHHIIQNLKEEIDVLAKQQEIFTTHFRIAKTTKSKRLIHVNKRCGCLRR